VFCVFPMLRFLYIGHSALVILAMQLLLHLAGILQERHQYSTSAKSIHFSLPNSTVHRTIVEAIDCILTSPIVMEAYASLTILRLFCTTHHHPARPMAWLDYVPARAFLHSSPSFISILPTSLISIPRATLRSSSAL
jgi:hypothetical protein